MLDVSLRLARAPVDAAIQLIPEHRARPRAAAEWAIDAVDSGTRSLLGLTSEGREVREPPPDPTPRPAARPRPRSPQPPASAVPAPTAAVPAPTAAVAAPTAAVPAAAASVPAPATPSPPPEPEPEPEPDPPRSPAHEEIAARAFELYEQGVPGDAESHWQAAERALSGRET